MMGNLLKFNFLRVLLKLSERIRFFLILLFLFSSHYNFAQEGIKKDTLVTKITLNSGAQIYSEDDSFNNQILRKEITLENSSVKYVENNRVLKLTSAQSIASNIDSKGSEEFSRKENNSAKNLVNVNKTKTVRVADFENNRFENQPSSNIQFYNICSGRDLGYLDSSNFKALKFLKQKKESSVNNLLIGLEVKLFNFYNNQIRHCRFSKVYSVRPPPIV